MKWMLVSDYLPDTDMRVGAVFCPTYSVYKDCSRLSNMSEQALRLGIKLVKQGMAQYLILSVSFWGQIEERRLKEKILLQEGIDKNQFWFLQDSTTNTYDEVRGALAILEDLCIDSLIVAADRYHMRRLLQIFRRLGPGLDLYNTSSVCRRYESVYNPSCIRRASVGVKWFHIVWNLVFMALTPIIVRFRRE